MIARAREFRDLLTQRAFIADGAMGTMLLAQGISACACLEELNLSAPHLVSEIHRQYAAAGAQILGSNTFGANRARLAAFGLTDKLGAINRAGVHLAREAAEAETNLRSFVAGTIGPTGVRTDEARAIFREQADALCGAGVDLLILETFTDLRELRDAVQAAREAAGEEMVVVAQMAAVDSVDRFAQEAKQWPADVIGFNCCASPQIVLQSLQSIAPHRKLLSAAPSAGLPCTVEGELVYPVARQQFAQHAREMFQAGAQIMGGCCGTTPRYIAEVVTHYRAACDW